MPSPNSTYDTIVFTVYDELTIVLFRVCLSVSPRKWLGDPNGATDYSGATPGGTTTYLMRWDRHRTQDPLLVQVGSRESLVLDSGNMDVMTFYGLGTANGDSATYATKLFLIQTIIRQLISQIRWDAHAIHNIAELAVAQPPSRHSNKHSTTS